MKQKLIDLSKKNSFLRNIFRDIVFFIGRIRYMFYFFKYKVDENTILFESYSGNSFSCNPKAIYLEILKNKNFKDYKFIWVFKNPEEKQHFFNNSNTILIKKNSKDYYKYLSISKYWIVNSLIDTAIKKKKNQIYVQTWHGTPLKKLRCDLEIFGSELNSKKDIKKRNDKDIKRIDYFLSPSSFATEKFISAFNLKILNKENTIIEEGYPRNDFLFYYTKKDVKNIKEKLNISNNKKIILYAPTFRDNQHDSKSGYTYKLNINFDILKKELDKEYIILFRAHYLITNNFDFKKYKDFIYNVSDYDDINDLYIISDVLITDYSSVFFDFANLKKPIYFYMYDLEEYKNNLRDFYINLEELPGIIVKTQKELINKITSSETIDKKIYKKFNDKYNYLDSENCSKKVINKIFRK